jgi:xanthine dehydrogenase accessory factor
MTDIFDSIERWRAEGTKIALATVIKVAGSAPRGEGAKMVVAGDGRVAGSVSGGCVEADVAEAALEVLATGSPKISRYGINRNMMWDVGLSCGGAIDVFIEPLPKLLPSPQQTSPLAMCSIVRGPSSIGARMSVDRHGRTSGRLVDPAVEAQAREAALKLMDTGPSQILAVGEYDVFIDFNLPEARLLLVGAVHIAVALCSMATRAGFSVSVIDHDQRFATASGFRMRNNSSSSGPRMR